MATYQELKAQGEEILRRAEAMRSEERAAAIAKVKEVILEWGLTAAELGLSGAAKTAKSTQVGKRAVVAAKYRDNATGNTWSGRGQAPKWLQAHLNAGKTRDEFLIK